MSSSSMLTLSVLGRSTSRIGFGTGGLLRIGSARRRQDTLAAALAQGITHFDTAPIYGFGESERALGRFLRGRRDAVTLTTKFGLRPAPLAARLASLQGAARGVLEAFPSLRRAVVRNAAALADNLYTAPCFNPGVVRASLESSLRSLGTDHVDFYLAHQASPAALPGEDLVEELERLREAGKIRCYGVATGFQWIAGVLAARPELGQVVQYDRDLVRDKDAGIGARAGQVQIIFGLLQRSIAVYRRLLESGRAVEPGLGRAFATMDDETLGTLLLRAHVIANPTGIVLMQSRSIARIERNARAAISTESDGIVRAMLAAGGSAA